MTSFLKQAREWASPTLKETAFLSRGVLTPEEFVKAGDELVFKCPTWSWEGGEKAKKNFLPPDKQYLVTRNVPCSERVAALENAMMGETEMEIPDDDADGEGGKGEGWLVSHVAQRGRPKQAGMEEEFDFVNLNEDGEGEILSSQEFKRTSVDMSTGVEAENSQIKPEAEDEYADMADFEDDNIQIDEATAAVAGNTTDGATDDDDNIKHVRTYDLSITYDKYYQTPRVWIYGYDEDGSSPLSPDEMFEDVMTDYVKRTVTIESHPHVSGPHLSIHPCQHGAVMKNIVRNLTRDDDSRAPTVEMYMFIFLKFVSSIIPTMNYDFTTEVSASTKKL